MSSTTIKLPQLTGSHGDALGAIGLAHLLGTGPLDGDQVRLREVDGAYAVECDSDPCAAILDSGRELDVPGYRYIRRGDKPPPSGLCNSQICDYAEERERTQRYFDQRKLLRGQKTQNAEINQKLADDLPTAAWKREQAAVALQSDASANQMAELLVSAKREDEQSLRRLIADAVSSLVMGAEVKVRWPARPVQATSPNWAKGAFSLKPNSTTRTNLTSGRWVEPFLDYLRLRGFTNSVVVFRTGSKKEHVRILTPAPRDISITDLTSIMNQTAESGIFGDGAKLDVLTALEVTELLVKHAKAQMLQTGYARSLSRQRRAPADFIGGLYVTHYQSMGQARAVASVFRIGIPSWFSIESPLDVQLWLAVLDEHRNAVRALNAERGDELNILLTYRRGLQEHGEGDADAAAFSMIEFLGDYGAWTLRGDAPSYRPRLSTTSTERMLSGMSSKLEEILQDPGFGAVAGALRKLTVTAQARKVRKMPKRHDTRFDLPHELRRTRSISDEAFMVCVADFVADFNRQNARMREMGREADANVATQHLQSLAALVDQHHAPLIGALLLGYGTCTAPYEARDESGPGTSSGDESENGTQEAEGEEGS